MDAEATVAAAAARATYFRELAFRTRPSVLMAIPQANRNGTLLPQGSGRRSRDNQVDPEIVGRVSLNRGDFYGNLNGREARPAHPLLPAPVLRPHPRGRRRFLVRPRPRRAHDHQVPRLAF